MYWNEELTRLGAHKAELQRDIARSRVQCVAAASRIARPMHRIDRLVEIWRGLPASVKLGAVPLGILTARLALPRRGIFGLLARWGPLAFAVARAVGVAKNIGAHQPALRRKHWRGSAGLLRRSPAERDEVG